MMSARVKRMIIAVVAFIVVLVVVLWLGAGRWYLTLPFPGPRTGRVVDASTDKPIGGARVLVHWTCYDTPMPDTGNQFVIEMGTTTGPDGKFELSPPVDQRSGLFGAEYVLIVDAAGYIRATHIYDPQGIPLPDSTADWPFVDTSTHKSLPQKMTIKLRPARPVLEQALESSDPQIRQTAKEELAKLKDVD